MSVNDYSNSESEGSDTIENTYCIFLHIVEGIGFNIRDNMGDIGEQRKSRVLLNASLNGVKFEVEGHTLSSETATIFNSNCIWECELGDIKRMKSDNRPVKLECFLKPGRSEHSLHKVIGSLLLPIRGVQILNNLTNATLKLHWHKLGTLSAEWRQNKPEIYLVLMIIKKTILESGQLESLLGKRKQSSNPSAITNCDIISSPHNSETALMLQSQNNVYVQLLEQVGLIQVGNNPDVDCDIFSVTLTFKQVKHVFKLLELEQNSFQYPAHKVFSFHYDFFGSNSHVQLEIAPNDWYVVNEKISLTFKSSLRSLREYFQRIFYVPINLCYGNIAVANYRFDFSKYLPDDSYFHIQKLWTKNATFYFDRLHKILSPRANKPSVDFIFSIQLLTSYAKRNNCEMVSVNETFGLYKGDNKTMFLPYDAYAPDPHRNLMPLSTRHFKTLELFDKYQKANSEPVLGFNDHEFYAKSVGETTREAISEKEEVIFNRLEYLENTSKSTRDAAVGTERVLEKSCIAVGLNTEHCNVDQVELSMKIVQELEEWKNQQMDTFLTQLTHKEKEYLRALEGHWEKQRTILQARLEAKISKCEQLNAQLEKAQLELNASAVRSREHMNVADAIKRDIENSYTQKFQQLDDEMQRLKMDLQERDSLFEIKNKQTEIENTRLEKEKAELNARIQKLEKELAFTQETHLSADQLKDVLADLRKQSDRAVAMEKSRNHYKKQWSKASQEISKMKLACLKLHEQDIKYNKNKKSKDFDLCLEKILNEEQEDLKQDRSELKDLKGTLFHFSDMSSSSEDEDIFFPPLNQS